LSFCRWVFAEATAHTLQLQKPVVNTADKKFLTSL
jgi:hypothetical protein